MLNTSYLISYSIAKHKDFFFTEDRLLTIFQEKTLDKREGDYVLFILSLQDL